MVASTRRRFNTAAELAGHMKVEDIQLFHVVVEQGSLGAAARALDMTTPTASKHLRRLEKSIGIRLFERSSRSLELTELGEQFLTHSLRLISELDGTFQFVQQSHDKPSGLLSLGIPLWLLKHIGTNFFADFRRKYPHIEFAFHDLVASRLNENIEVDLILGVFMPANRQMNTRPLFPITATVYASENYLEQAPPLTHPNQLVNHPCLVLRNPFWPDNHWPWTDQDGNTTWARLNTIACFDCFEPIIDWMVQGLGVAFLPEPIKRRSKHADKLRPLFQQELISHHYVNCYTPSRRLAPPKVEVFIHELTQWLRSHP